MNLSVNYITRLVDSILSIVHSANFIDRQAITLRPTGSSLADSDRITARSHCYPSSRIEANIHLVSSSALTV